MDQLSERLKKLISEELAVDIADVTLAASLVDDLGADSLDAVELVMKIEEEFELEIPDAESEKLKTVQDILDYLVGHGKT